MTRRPGGWWPVALLALGLAGAANSGLGQAARDTTAREGAARDTTRGNGASRSYVPADSLPSPDARDVLRSIPEPLPPGESVPARADSLARRDTIATDSSGVPVPSPTAPLGEVPGSVHPPASADSARVTGPGPGSGPAPGTAPAGAAPDTCWRVQLGAPIDSTEAKARLAAAESQLLVPVVIEKEKGRYKVRTRGCLGAEAAESLRARALASGFHDAFRIRMTPEGAIGAPAAPGHPSKKPASGTKPSTAKKKAAAKAQARRGSRAG